MSNNIDELIAKLLQATETKSIKVEDAIKIFYRLLDSKGVRPMTIKYYQNLYTSLKPFLRKHNITMTSEINDELLITLIEESKVKGHKESYINKLIAALKYLISLLYKYEYISNYEFKTCKLKERENPIQTIDLSYLPKILQAAKDISYKCYTIVSVLLATGVRRTELINIKLSNLNLNDNSIFLETTKTGNIRYVFFNDDVKETIKFYLAKYNPNFYLFETDEGKMYNPHTISTYLDKIKKVCKIEKLSAHQFRHTFATEIYNSSQNIELTRVTLGHTNYAMTKRYIHHSKNETKILYSKFFNIKIT